MRTFSEFSQEFSNWMLENNLNYNYEEYIKYIWEIPKNAVSQWKTELDEYKDLFTDEVYQTYINQFEPGGSILGIYNVVHDNSSIAKLYKLTSTYKEFTIDNILVSRNFQLPVPPNRVTLPDGLSVNLPTSIEHGTLNLFEPYNKIDLVDSTKNPSRGSLTGTGFSSGIRDSNMLNSNSFLATINYQSGILHIIRNNNSNEDKFIKYYKWLVEEINHSNSHTCSSGSGTNGSGSSPSSFHSLHSLSQVTPYDYISVSGSFYALGAPLTLVFQFDCNQEPPDSEDEEYKSLVSYSSNQETIINQIKSSLALSMKNNQNIINKFSGNYDFQLGTTISL